MGQTASCYDIVAKTAPNHNEFAHRGAAVVTGATSGIGIPTVESCLLAGFDRVYATARSEKAATALVDAMKAKLGDEIASKLTIVSCDLMDLATVKKAAEQIERESGADGVSVAILNAGIMAVPYRATAQGLESQIGTNHFAHVLFADLIEPALRRSGAKTTAADANDPARLVFVSSEAHKMGPGARGFDESTFEYDAARSGSYSAWTAYGQSKLANVLAALDFDTRYKAEKIPIAAFSLHPGVITDTGLGKEVGGFSIFKVISKPFVKNCEQGAATSIYCGLAKEALPDRGGYFSDASFTGATAKGQNVANAAALMKITRDTLTQKVAEAAMKDATA